MDLMTDTIVHYRRYLKRRNYSPHTIRNYMNTLKHFVLWLDEPIEKVTHKKMAQYIDCFSARGLNLKRSILILIASAGFIITWRMKKE